MADLQRGRFRLWPWRRRSGAAKPASTPPSAQEFADKLTELIQLERGITALYYYLPDASLAAYAQLLCRRQQDRGLDEAGVDRELRAKEAIFEPWQAVSALWCSEVWQPDEILATFGYRLIEALRVRNDLWSVVLDPRAQFYGLAAAKDDRHRYWLALVVGQKGAGGGRDTATAAR
jgi:hypothetical protein